jgi:hypothetical protein
LWQALGMAEKRTKADKFQRQADQLEKRPAIQQRGKRRSPARLQPSRCPDRERSHRRQVGSQIRLTGGRPTLKDVPSLNQLSEMALLRARGCSTREYRLTPPTGSETPVGATAHNNLRPRRDEDSPRLRYPSPTGGSRKQQGIEFHQWSDLRNPSWSEWPARRLGVTRRCSNYGMTM